MRKVLTSLAAVSLVAAVPANASNKSDDQWLGMGGSSELELGAYLAAIAVVIAVIAANAGSSDDEPVSP